MNASALHATTLIAPARLVPLFVLIGGALNGFVVRLSEAWFLDGLGSAFVGVSPFEVITLCVATYLVATSETGDSLKHTSYLPEIVTALAFLVPSSTVSWAALAAYAGYRAWGCNGQARLGILLFAGLAVAAIWSSVAMKLLAPTVTSLEASIVAAALSVFKSGVIQNGNVVGVPDQHVLIIMAACSTLDGLVKAFMALAAVSVLAGNFGLRRLAGSALVLALVYAVANYFRLTVMALSQEWYETAHGPIGANVFDATIILVVFALALREARQ